MQHPRVAILGGGLAGVACAFSLANSGWKRIVVVERGDKLGGLAGSFERDNHFYPLGYHHILHRDQTLLWFLQRIGALERVRWRKVRMLFRLGGRFYDLAHPIDFLRFPMTLMDKLRFVRLMLRAFRKSDWSEWEDRNARELLDAWAGPGVRRAIFEPLCQLKFKLPSEEVSAAWLGARLHFREGSAPLGYIPGANWTKVLCDGLTGLLDEHGVEVRLRRTVTGLETEGGRVVAAHLDDGQRLDGDAFVSALPTEVFQRLARDETTPDLNTIRYTALISVICATRRPVQPDFYWMNLASLDRTACGLFRLESLNPTIGVAGDTCVNFVTHLQSRDDPLFKLGDEELLSRYEKDFREIFGVELDPFWTQVNRVPMYSPIFRQGYRNPPLRSATWNNVFFAGNYRTFPSIASTGTAMASGLQAANEVLSRHATPSTLEAQVAAFKLGGMPRA